MTSPKLHGRSLEEAAGTQADDLLVFPVARPAPSTLLPGSEFGGGESSRNPNFLRCGICLVEAFVKIQDFLFHCLHGSISWKQFQ